jgi:hypothetical protein
MKTTWTHDELKAALMAADQKWGDWPEHKWEGLAVYQWLVTGDDEKGLTDDELAQWKLRARGNDE